MDKAFARFEVKSYDEEKREFSGIATTPTPDRVLDVVEPMGAFFKLPLPLLGKHNKDKPIGNVIEAKVTPKGIEYVARIPKVEEEGLFKDRVDEAWQEIKYGVVRGVSIGFLPVEGEVERLKTGGYRFKKWEWTELSPVPIPAHQEATIARIKSLANDSAASGNEESISKEAEKSANPGVSGKHKVVNLKPEMKGKSQMNVKEQLDAAKAKRAELQKSMQDAMAKATGEGRTLDAQEAEAYDNQESEVAALDKHIGRLENLEKSMATTAKPVDGQTQKGATESRQSSVIQVKDNRVRGDGIALAQMVKCIYKGQGNLMMAQQAAEANQKLDPRVAQVLKTAVAAGTTDNSAWAGFLVGDETSVYADFVEFLRPRTILGRFGNGGIPGLRRVPFRTPLISQTAGATGYWVGEGQAKPLTKIEGARTTIEPLKVANIAVVTEEIVRDSSPSADALVRDQLVAALAARLDIDFMDPDKVAVSGISPASILNGVAGISSTGSDADAVRADIKALWTPFIVANNPPTTAVYVMSAQTALSLSLMMNAFGQPEFPGITMNGGTLLGVPVIVSEYMTNDGGSSGGIVALVNASDIYFADEGGFMVDMSREASVQMDDTPDNPTTASTVLVSLWQRNLVGFRAERTVNWARRRSTSVSWLDAVTWGS